MLLPFTPDSPEICEIWDQNMPDPTLLRWILSKLDLELIHKIFAPLYHPTLGTTAYCPTVIFRYQLLKRLFNLSDGALVQRCKTDAYFRMFLGLPLFSFGGVVDPTVLSKFRTQKLNRVPDLIELIISMTMGIARSENIPIDKDVVIDATHTHARYELVTEMEFLQKKTRQLRRDIYKNDESYVGKFPEKPTDPTTLQEIEYTRNLLEQMKAFGLNNAAPNITEQISYLIEIIDDWDKLCEEANSGARNGMKSKDEKFHGWKTHYVLSSNRLIVGAMVSSGEKADCTFAIDLVEMVSRTIGGIDSLIGDRAYSTTAILEYCEKNGILAVSRLNPTSSAVRDSSLIYNKDSDGIICHGGEHSIKTRYVRTKKNRADGAGGVVSFFMDINKCAQCPLKDGCYNGGKTRSFSATIPTNTQTKQADFQETDEFKSLMSHRYKIEAKNAEMKEHHGFRRADGVGFASMENQAATTIMATNLKRIFKLSQKNNE